MTVFTPYFNSFFFDTYLNKMRYPCITESMEKEYEPKLKDL